MAQECAKHILNVNLGGIAMKERILNVFKGEMTIGKMNVWLIGGVCFFAGITFGLLKAPWTHGVTIGSHNGNNSRLGYGDEDECECIGECCCEED